MKKTVPIKKNYEFLKVYKRGKFFVGKQIILYALANNFDINRLGITVSKKLGGSVVRNRNKRLIKENYRLYEEKLITGFDLVFVSRDTGTEPNFASIRKEMKFLFKKLNLIDL